MVKLNIYILYTPESIMKNLLLEYYPSRMEKNKITLNFVDFHVKKFNESKHFFILVVFSWNQNKNEQKLLGLHLRKQEQIHTRTQIKLDDDDDDDEADEGSQLLRIFAKEKHLLFL